MYRCFLKLWMVEISYSHYKIDFYYQCMYVSSIHTAGLLQSLICYRVLMKYSVQPWYHVFVLHACKHDIRWSQNLWLEVTEIINRPLKSSKRSDSQSKKQKMYVCACVYVHPGWSLPPPHSSLLVLHSSWFQTKMKWNSVINGVPQKCLFVFPCSSTFTLPLLPRWSPISRAYGVMHGSLETGRQNRILGAEDAGIETKHKVSQKKHPNICWHLFVFFSQHCISRIRFRSKPFTSTHSGSKMTE